MKHILVYSDSISWGIIPMSRNRLPFDQRWPGILEISLNQHGKQVRVIEDCLNGRRTMYEDPIKTGRNGLIGLAQRIEVNSPLALVIIMLGTNDIVVGGGMESMSNVPYYLDKARTGYRMGHGQIIDGMIKR